MSSLENPEHIGLADPQRLEVHLHALPRVMTQLVERVLLHTEPLRDLRVWHPFELGHEHRALLLRQLPLDDVRERAQDALAHRAPLLRRLHPRLEHERRTRPLEHRVEGDVPPPLVTEVVEGDAHGDRERPGGEPALPSEPTEPLANAEERLLREVFAEILVRTTRREHSHEPGDEDLAQIATRGFPIGAVVRDRANPLGVLARRSPHLDHRIRAKLIGENGAHGAHVQYDEPSEVDLTRRWLGKKSHRRIVEGTEQTARHPRDRRSEGFRHPMSSTNAPIADHLLGDRVAAFHTELAKQASAEVVRALVSEIDGVVRCGAGAKAPRVGDTAPSFTLPDAQGKQVSLDSLLKEGRVVIAFYRGQWCPYCDLQLRAYQEVLPRIKALGANLVAISPQTPDESLSTVEKRKLEFRVLSDAGNKVARGYGLVWKVPAGLDALHKGWGVDLTKSNGDASNELPVPGTFVLGADGRIAFSYVNADWRERLEPAEIIRALERLGRGK